MFIERDGILINTNNVCCIAKNTNKISINLVSGKTVNYMFNTIEESNQAYQRLMEAISCKTNKINETHWFFDDDF